LTTGKFGISLVFMHLHENDSHLKGKRKKWIGLAAFLFFLVKGLLWLTAGAGLTYLAKSAE
jgi:hypothetical protein